VPARQKAGSSPATAKLTAECNFVNHFLASRWKWGRGGIAIATLKTRNEFQRECARRFSKIISASMFTSRVCCSFIIDIDHTFRYRCHLLLPFLLSPKSRASPGDYLVALCHREASRNAGDASKRSDPALELHIHIYYVNAIWSRTRLKPRFARLLIVFFSPLVRQRGP
jgi:hypothetical protein